MVISGSSLKTLHVSRKVGQAEGPQSLPGSTPALEQQRVPKRWPGPTQGLGQVPGT